MRKDLKASFTVEAALLIPLIMVVFGVLLSLLLYYHDRMLLVSAVQESAVYGSSRENKTDKEIEKHLRELIEGRLLLLKDFRIEIDNQKTVCKVSCTVNHSVFQLGVESKMIKTEPEQYIRTIRKLEKIGDEVKD